LLLPRQYDLTVTKINEMTNFTFYSTDELFFFKYTFGDYQANLDMNKFQEVYTAYLKTRTDYNETLLKKA